MHQPEVDLSHGVAVVVEHPHRARPPRAAYQQFFFQLPPQSRSDHVLRAFDIPAIDVAAEADTVLAMKTSLAALRTTLTQKQPARMLLTLAAPLRSRMCACSIDCPPRAGS